MTMFLPNSAVRPTGYEAGEFIDAPDPFDRARAENPNDASRTTPPSPASAPQPDHRETTQQVF
jgi:hypothetical protein